jgi:hypothetical protein
VDAAGIAEAESDAGTESDHRRNDQHEERKEDQLDETKDDAKDSKGATVPSRLLAFGVHETLGHRTQILGGENAGSHPEGYPR